MAGKTAAVALQAEQIGDVEEGTPPPENELDELGLNAEDRAAWDEMERVSKLPPGAEEVEEAPPAEGEGEEPAPAEGAPAAAPRVKKQEPPEEDDEPDQITRDPRTGREQRTISYGKHQRLLNKARQDAETFRTQIEQGRVDHAKLAERLAILNEALQAPPPPTPEQQAYQRQQEIAQNPMLEETIDPAVDLAGALGQMQRRQIYMANASMMQQEATQEQLQDRALVDNFARDVHMFSATEEGRDFMGQDGAYQFLKNSRLIELGLSLYDKDPSDLNERFTDAQINEMVRSYNEEEKWVVSNALQQGKSPAKQMLRLAKGRGWRPPAPPAPAPPPPRQGAPRSPQGVRTQGVPPPLARLPAQQPQPRNAVAQIQAEQAGAAASRSLSDGGGVPPGEPLSVDQLLKMDDEEFGIFIDNLPKNRLDAIMGRDFPRRE